MKRNIHVDDCESKCKKKDLAIFHYFYFIKNNTAVQTLVVCILGCAKSTRIFTVNASKIVYFIYILATIFGFQIGNVTIL